MAAMQACLFIYPSYREMGQQLLAHSAMTEGDFKQKRFPNKELYLTIATAVNHQPCFILGSIIPPEENILSLLLLCHTLKKEHAANITVILPYLAYSRHDKNEKHKSFNAALIAQLFQAATVDKIITFDVHSERVKKNFSMPLISLSPAKVFADIIIANNMQHMTLVAPDDGAINRCKALAKRASMHAEITYLEKNRDEKGVSHSELIGNVSNQVIIVDDILDTGGTLISCCKKLKASGVEEIYIMVTHGQFTGNEWQELWRLGVKHIYCTDTLPIRDEVRTSRITVLSIVPILKEYLTQHAASVTTS